MANEFKIKKGLIVTGASGGTVVDILGSQGQLLSVTDDLSGSVFAVSDISGVPILNINSSGLSTFNGLVSGITPVNAANFVTKAYVDGPSGGTGPFLPLAGGTMTGKAVFPSAIASRPQLPGGFIGIDTGDADVDIWGISRDYYPSNPTTANAWGLKWGSSPNQFQWVGAGINRITFDLDQGNIVTLGNLDVDGGTLNVGSSNQVNIVASGASLFPSLKVNNSGYLGSASVPNQMQLLSSGSTIFSGLVSGITPTAAANFTTKAYVDSFNPPTGTTQFFNQSSSYNNSTPGVTGYGNIVMDTSVSYYDTGKNVVVGTRGMVWTGKHYIFTDHSGKTAKFYNNNFDLITNPEASTITLPATSSGGHSPHGAAWDGRYLYCVTYSPMKIVAYNLDNGTTTATLVSETDISSYSTTTYAIEYAEGHLYTCADGKVSKFKVEGKTITHVFTSGVILSTIDAQAITYDGSYLWFTQNGLNAYKVSLDCVLVATITTGLPPNNIGWAWNGQNVATVNYQTGDVYILNTAETRFDTEEFIVMGGNVGIGTTSPDNILHIETAASGGPQIQLESTSGTAAAAFINFDSTNLQLSTQRDMVDGTWYDTAKSWGGINIQGPAGGSFITFQTAAASNTSPSEKMRIASSGNVGIGDTSPDYRLAVKKVNAATPAIMVSGAYYGGPRIQTYGLDADANAWMGLGTDMSGAAYEHNIYFSDYNNNGRLSIGTYNGTTYSEKMCVLRTGYVGIGTDSPTEKLHIKSTTSGSFIRFEDNGGSGVYVGSRADDLEFYAGNSEKMVILSGGNVGINVTGPSKKLEVAGSFKLGTNAYIEYGGVYPYTITTANTAAVGNLVFSAGLGSAAYESKIDLQGTNTAGVAGITLSTASTARMVVTADGNVGIGTTSPYAKLEAQGPNIVSASPVVIKKAKLLNLSLATSAYYGGFAEFWMGRYANVSNHAKSILTISLNDGLYGSNTNADTDVMTLRGDGNVGIGTTSPIDKLNVNGGTGDATTQQPKITVTRTSSTGNVLAGKMILTTKPSDPTNHGNLVFQVKTTASSGESSAYYTDAITIDGKNANVGIGTSTPLAKLDIQGTQGQLFSVTDDLSGSIFAVSDISGVPIFDVNSNGKVGINTTSANDIFDVRSASWATRIQSTADGTYLRMSPNQIATFNSANAGSPLYINNSSSGDIIMAGGGGAVLVGATSTYFNYGGSTLHVGGTRATLGLKSSGSLATIALSSGNNSTNDIHINHDGTTGALNFYQYSVTPVSARVSMFLAGNGDLGLGTTVPDEKLTVNGITRAVDPIYFGAISTDNGTYGPYIESSDDKGLKFDYNGNSGGEFQVWNHDQNGGGALEVFNIDQDGKVRINTPSGNDRLNVKGALALWPSTGISSAIRLNPDGDSYINGGDLGVGNTLPQHKLDVSGTIRSYNYKLSGNTTNPTTTAATIYDQAAVGLTLSAHNIELRGWTGSAMVRSAFFQHNAATFTGTCTATNFILSSDKTLKENIKDIGTKHIDVNWKNFELKSEPGVKRSGVIAQELETKHPEFVRTDEEGLKSVAYIDLLIAKIAELEARLEKAGI